MKWGVPRGGVLVCRMWMLGRESRLVQTAYEAGLLSTDVMRNFDAMCLPEVKQLTPPQIKGVS